LWNPPEELNDDQVRQGYIVLAVCEVLNRALKENPLAVGQVQEALQTAEQDWLEIEQRLNTPVVRAVATLDARIAFGQEAVAINDWLVARRLLLSYAAKEEEKRLARQEAERKKNPPRPL